MKKSGNTILWVLVAIIALIALFTVYNKFKTGSEIGKAPQTQNTTQKTGEGTEQEKPKVPDFELKDLDGNTVKLSDFKDKVIVLNFWATWCKYCVMEMPDFNELNSEFEKAGDAVILAVNVQEDAGTVKKYLDENNISLKVLMDQDGKVASDYGVNGYPNTYIINKDGTLYKYIPGATSKEVVRGFVDEIR